MTAYLCFIRDDLPIFADKAGVEVEDDVDEEEDVDDRIYNQHRDIRVTGGLPESEHTLERIARNDKV